MKNKTVVIYGSKYGSTQKYAMWIAEELGCHIYNNRESGKIDFKEYDTVILGGGLYAGGISGSSIITKRWEELKNKNIVIFTVGLTDPENIDYKSIINKNFNDVQRDSIKFFYLRGGMDYKKLGFLHKIMMAMLIRILKSKKDSELTDDNKNMIENYGGIVDFVKRPSIKPILGYVKNIIR